MRNGGFFRSPDPAVAGGFLGGATGPDELSTASTSSLSLVGCGREELDFFEGAFFDGGGRVGAFLLGMRGDRVEGEEGVGWEREGAGGAGGAGSVGDGEGEGEGIVSPSIGSADTNVISGRTLQ